jgi:hypothetical protein
VIASLLIAVKFFLKDIGKKEKPENAEHDKKFDQDNPPEPPAPGHVPESIVIKSDYSF